MEALRKLNRHKSISHKREEKSEREWESSDREEEKVSRVRQKEGESYISLCIFCLLKKGISSEILYRKKKLREMVCVCAIWGFLASCASVNKRFSLIQAKNHRMIDCINTGRFSWQFQSSLITLENWKLYTRKKKKETNVYISISFYSSAHIIL